MRIFELSKEGEIVKDKFIIYHLPQNPIVKPEDIGLRWDEGGEVKKGAIEPSQIDEKLFSRYLYTRDCPDPDLLIRTSGEMRVSNFLLWQISYAEIYVTSKLWPDFRESDLRKAIEEYQRRERRFGR